MEEYAPRDSLQGVSGQADTCGKCFRCNSEESTQDPFMKAWKAIEDGDFSKLDQAIQEIKKSETGSFPSLDTRRRIEGGGLIYSMSLLALCGFHGREDMLDLLLKNGADMNAECEVPKGKDMNAEREVHTGTPICQLMLHCLLQDKTKLSDDMIDYFKKKGAKLDGKIITHRVGQHDPDNCTITFGMLDLPLSMENIDSAKQLVKIGVDLISGGSADCEKIAIVPMFQEYRDHGTNEFIRWAFNEYIPNHPEIDLKRVIQRIIQSIIHMKKRDRKFCWWDSVQRSPAHAILTCHHKKTIERLVECAKKSFDGLDLLAEQSCTGKTALHVAAENDDVESVQILLQLGADTTASDKFGMNPFMLAVEKGNLEVVKAMMEKDPDLLSSPVGCRSTMAHWVLKQGHHRSDFFKGWFEKAPRTLLTTKDSQGNTIAHVVAASENTEVFKMLWSEEFQDVVFSSQNLEGKTPLELAVEKGHVNILETLESCIDKGKVETAPMWCRKLKAEWWKEMGNCIVHASSKGSLRAVKYFIDKGQKPHISHNDKTPLLCAAEAGHDEIVEYLLEFDEVQADLKNKKEKVDNASASPLLIAAQNGHTRCVTLLLQNGGYVLQRDSEDRNCLVLAIQNHHKATALAILSVKNGLKALKTSPTPQQSLSDRKPTPLQLLIKEMPELAEYVLNECITQDGEDQPVKYNFDILKDQVPHKHHDHHTLFWMIKYNRLELLKHPLVEAFFSQKFWVKAFPLFKLLLYCLFLVAFNIFVVVIPRPGPDSEACQSETKWIYLAATVIVLCVLGLVVEILQLMNIYWRYFKNPDNYFQLASYIVTLIFIVSLVNGNDNWCSTPEQWQIRTFTIFLPWLNFIFILKDMPYTASPINMIFSICVTFLTLIFLAMLLILTFGIPFYVGFAKESGNLTAFKSPIEDMTKTFVQLAGEFVIFKQAIFSQANLLYSPTTHTVFFILLVTGPFVFRNLLNALAVGETLEKVKKAKLTTHYLWMKLILEQGWMKGLYTCGDYKTEYNNKSDDSSREPLLLAFAGFRLKEEYSIHANIAKECKKRNEEIYSTVMAQKPVRDDIVAPHKVQNPVREDIIELRKDICNFKQEMMLLYKKSEEELLGRQEVTVQTHAESTAMTAGYLRGLDVTGETSILVTNQAQTFHWVGYGLKLHIPQGTLPADLEKCQLLIKVGLSGQFKLPENSSLVSAVYWLDSEPRCKFSQPITVEMQHCVKPSHTSRLSFVHAKCSQVQLPYDFKAVEGGVFSSESAYGCVQLYHFSLVGLIKFIRPEVVYCASLYYLVNQREIHFVITKNLAAYITVIKQKYRDAIVGPDLQIEFESDKISLPISLQGTTLEDGWKLFPLIRPVITKKEVDSFKPGRRIPSCQLKAKWTKESKPPQLNYPVTLDGARESSNYFCIDIDWDSTQPDLHHKYNSNLESEPDLPDLMNKIAAKIPSKWKDIGLQLGVDQGVLDGIATISLGDPNHCYINVFTRWKNQNSPTHRYTWSTLVQALKKPAVGEDRLADEIKNELTGNQL